MYKVAHNEGVRALFSGLTASILGISHALIYFPLYEKMKVYFHTNWEKAGTEKLSDKYVFASAIFSKLISSSLTYPHEVLRAR
jgi:solute carrier family 25 folate transporter 32